jgi:hypothetical protein
MRPRGGIDCNHLAPLTVLATIAAFLMSICFRQMAKHKERSQRWFLAACLLIAAATLFADFRYVRHYRGICDSLGQQLRHTN